MTPRLTLAARAYDAGHAAGQYPQISRRALTLVCLLVAFCIAVSGCSLRKGGSSTDQPKGVSVKKGARGTKPYTIRGKTYYPLLSSHGFREEGVASWYGKDFHGKKTANGERYDMYGMTAAHKLLPFGTKVKVTNRENGKSIVVRINDRGPFVANRVIDLTKTGAERIGMIAKGTAPVLLETVGTVKGLQAGTAKSGGGFDIKGDFYVQIGAFANKSNAENLLARLGSKGKTGRLSYSEQSKFWRVQAGPYASLNDAENASKAMLGEYPNNFAVAD